MADESNATPDQSTGNQSAGQWVGPLILIAALGFFAWYGFDSWRNRPASLKSIGAEQAISLCKSKIQSQLTNPETAKFPTAQAEWVNDYWRWQGDISFTMGSGTVEDTYVVCAVTGDTADEAEAVFLFTQKP